MPTAALTSLSLLVPASAVTGGQTDAERPSQLEQMMLAFRARVAALEASAPTQTCETTDGDGIRWRFEPPATGRPLAVTQKQLDQSSGSAELLLEVTAPLPERGSWLHEGSRTPRVPVATHADRSEASHPARLVRRSGLEPGSFLPVRAPLEPGEITSIVDIPIRSERTAQQQPSALPQRAFSPTNLSTEHQRP